jgi:hypothetical protein
MEDTINEACERLAQSSFKTAIDYWASGGAAGVAKLRIAILDIEDRLRDLRSAEAAEP